MKKILLLMSALFLVGATNMYAQDEADTHDLTSDMFKQWGGYGAGATSTGDANVDFNIGNDELLGEGAVVCGTSTVDYLTYANLTGSTKLIIEGTAGTRLRVLMNRQESNSGPLTERNPMLDDEGKAELDLTDLSYVHINAIKIAWGSSGKISSIQYVKPSINYIEASKVYEAPFGTTDVKDLTGTEPNWANSVTYPKAFAYQGATFGNGDGSNESTHVDIEGYDYLCFEVTEATSNTVGLRAWIWDDVNNTVVTLYAKPIADYATANYAEASKITATGTYVVKVSDYKYLKGVKATNDNGSSAAKVSMAWMCEGDAPVAYPTESVYELVGEVAGSATLEAALSDPNAVYIDATGVTGTDVDLTPGDGGNRNCIFVANEGVLANGANVCVDGNIENLVLQDGYPVYNGFGGPIQTANYAEYRRDMENRFGTLYLPFAFDATAIADRNFYAVSGMTNDGGITLQKLAIVAAGVPCIVEKVDGSDAATTIYADGGEHEMALNTPAIPSQKVGNFNVSVIGSYKEETINTTMTSALSPVYYGLSNNTLVQATETLTVKPFRAYVKATPVGEVALEVLAALRFVIEDEEATAIKNLNGNGSAKVVGIFSVNGARQNSLQKGMNVVKFSDGKSQKVLVK